MAARVPLHALPSRKPQKDRSRWSGWVEKLVAGVAAAQRPASIAWDQIKEHGYFIAGAGFIDSAGFVHSLFTGLIVTGISCMAIEWRVSKSA